jgi:hypothetical protein
MWLKIRTVSRRIGECWTKKWQIDISGIGDDVGGKDSGYGRRNKIN